MIYYIYKITSQTDGKIYVGQRRTKNPLPDPDYMGSGLLISRSLNKYGKELFKKEILEVCKDPDHLNRQEIFWIKELDCLFPKGLNIALGGHSICDIRNHPEKERICQDISRTLKQYFKDHPEARDIGRQNGLRNKGKSKSPFTEQHKNNIRIARSKQGPTNKGRKFSRKWRKALSQAHLGKPSGKKGKKLSQKTIDKLKVKVICPHCKKTGGICAMKTWHFDNCRNKLKTT